MSTHDHRRPIPLAMALEGERVRVVASWADTELRAYLAEMGLHIDAQLTVRVRIPGDTLVITHGETRLAIGEEMAQKVLVETELSGTKTLANRSLGVTRSRC